MSTTMSTTTFAISVIAAFTLGITLATILVWIVGTDTEESDAARRAALGCAAARARTQSPPVQSTEMVDRGTTRVGLPVVVDERMPPGVAVLVGPDEVDAWNVSFDERGGVCRRLGSTRPLYVGRGWDNVLGYSEAGDGGWVDEANERITEQEFGGRVVRVPLRSGDVARIPLEQADGDSLNMTTDDRGLVRPVTEQELAARVAQSGGAHGWAGTDETRLLLCHELSADGGFRCTLPRGHASKHQAGPLSGDAA